MDHLKVLLISHNPVSTQNNMGKTFLSLFSGVDRQELCQLYIYPTVPDVDRCCSYYRVTDKEMVASVLRRKKAGGELDRSLISEAVGAFEHSEDEALYRNRKNKSPLRRLLRDGIWKLGSWYSADLQSWLEREKPTCIFVAPGVAMFLYDIALKISAKLNIPIITYICDEFYFLDPTAHPLEKLRRALFRRKMKQLMAHTRQLVVICEELRVAYQQEFAVKTTTLMTGAGFPVEKIVHTEQNPKQICYFGNIRCNRFHSLCQIGQELDAINAATGTDYKLKIYTFEKDRQILDLFRDIRSVELCGAVTGEAYDRAFRAAELLLHTEAFDEESIGRVRNSVSTKIADSLASGIPLFAYGPASVASMGHLIRNQCAITATSREELREKLICAFSDSAARQQAALQGLAVAGKNHDARANGIVLRNILMDTSEA